MTALNALARESSQASRSCAAGGSLGAQPPALWFSARAVPHPAVASYSFLRDVEATLHCIPVSETTQPVSAFGRKVKKKDPGANALMTLGIVGIVACLIAIALVFTNMGGL